MSGSGPGLRSYRSGSGNQNRYKLPPCCTGIALLYCAGTYLLHICYHFICHICLDWVSDEWWNFSLHEFSMKIYLLGNNDDLADRFQRCTATFPEQGPKVHRSTVFYFNYLFFMKRNRWVMVPKKMKTYHTNVCEKGH